MDAGIPSVGGPSALLVEFTSHCNLKCSMCPLTARRCASGLLPGHVSEDVWKRIVEFARGVEVVTVAGYGEPLMNPKCVDYLRELDDLGIATSLTTTARSSRTTWRKRWPRCAT